MTYVSWVLLLREIDPAAVEVRNIGPYDTTLLPSLAKIASKEGFDLMYQLRDPPDMGKVRQLASDGELSTMDGVEKLWVLQ